MAKKVTIEATGLDAKDARNALEVTYKKNHYVFYTDMAGLDYFDGNDFKLNQEEGHELFCAIVDEYKTIGLQAALIKAGATITPRKQARGYYAYKIKGMIELWRGKIEDEFSYRAGYVSDIENFEMAIDAAEEEMRCLMAEAN